MLPDKEKTRTDETEKNVKTAAEDKDGEKKTPKLSFAFDRDISSPTVLLFAVFCYN